MRKSQHTKRYRRLVEALRKEREKCGYTQEEVATKLGTYASFISKAESGERRLDVVELAELCRLYEVDLVAFLRDAGMCD